MKDIFIIILSIFIPFLSFSEVERRLCVNCKFFKGNFIIGDEYGRCSFFSEREMTIDLVTGIKKDAKYQFCSIARDNDDMCGKEGKRYINKGDNN